MEVRSQPLQLRDGAVVVVRPLERSDRAGLAEAVLRLSPRSRYLRFFTAKPGLTERELDVLTDLDRRHRDALVAVDPATRRGIAVARYAELPAEPGVVDVAVTVADEWQGRGLGTLLLARLVARARQAGHTALRASVLAENAASLAMVRRAGFRPLGSDGASVELELVLRPPAAVASATVRAGNAAGRPSR